jgi:hypothetical protein
VLELRAVRADTAALFTILALSAAALARALSAADAPDALPPRGAPLFLAAGNPGNKASSRLAAALRDELGGGDAARALRLRRAQRALVVPAAEMDAWCENEAAAMRAAAAAALA